MVTLILRGLRALPWGGGLLALMVVLLMTQPARPGQADPAPTAQALMADMQASQRHVRLILGDVEGQGLFDVTAVRDVVGNDPEALVQWVQEQTAHVPYPGLVRGEFGALQDRLGNHLDRAMLLGRLIEATGRAVRLEVMAPGRRSPAARLADERPRPQPLTLGEETRELLVHLGSLSDVPPASSHLPGWNRFDQDLQARALSLMERLGEDPGFPAWHEQAGRQTLKDDPSVRVWWQDDQGHWLASDLGEAATGEQDASQAHAAPGEESLSLSAASRRHAHYYAIEVVAERWQKGRFERVTLLEHDLQAHALAMRSVRIGVVPEALEVDGFYTRDPDQALADDLLANTAWVPYLRDGEEMVLGDLIDQQGRVRDPMQPDQARQLEEATSLLGGLSLGGRNPAEGPEDAFIGLSLEVTHRHAGEVINRLSRPWFSLASDTAPAFELEPEQRLERAVALLRDSHLLIQVAEPSEALLWRHGLGLFLRNTHALKGMIMALDDDDFESFDSALQALVDLPQTALQFARHRFTASLHPGRLYIGEPNLLIEHSGLKQGPDGFSDYRAIDLAHVPLHLALDGDALSDAAQNDVAQNDAAQNDAARQWRFSQGVLETLLEAELLAQRYPLPDRGRVLDGENAALHLEAAMASGASGHWLRPGQPDRLDALGLPALSQRAIRSQLEQGQHVFLPLATSTDALSAEQPLPLAWWAVDPGSGHTLGYGGIGWGQESTQYSLLLSLQVRFYLLKTSLAPTVAKSALGTSLVCGLALTLTSLQVYSAFGGDLHWAVDEASGEAERVVNFCLDVINRRLPPGS